MSKKIKVGIIGTRGIPNNYGGFERFIELFVKEHNLNSPVSIVIYGEKNTSNHNGKNYSYVSQFFSKKNGILYYFEAALRSSFRCDVIFCCGVGISFSAIIPKIFNRKLIINPDGCEWKRKKWSKFGRILLKLIFYPVLKIADKIIVDSEALKDDFGNSFSQKYIYIPYQIPDAVIADSCKIKKFGFDKYLLEKKSFFLVISRLEPEQNISMICESFLRSNSTSELIIVGKTDTQYYKNELNKYHNNSISFLGGIYDQSILNFFRSNCKLYIHGHTVGGTNPSLIEALNVCNKRIACFQTKYNFEVARNNAQYFKDQQSLTKIMNSNEYSVLEQWNDDRFLPRKIYDDYMETFLN